MCYKLLARKPRQDKKTNINDNNSEHQPEKTKNKTIIQSTGRKRQELKTVIQSTGHQILKLVTPIRTGACKRRGERGARQDGRCVCVCIGGRHHCRVYVDTFLFAGANSACGVPKRKSVRMTFATIATTHFSYHAARCSRRRRGGSFFPRSPGLGGTWGPSEGTDVGAHEERGRILRVALRKGGSCRRTITTFATTDFFLSETWDAASADSAGQFADIAIRIQIYVYTHT